MRFSEKSRAVISVFLIITMLPLLGLVVVLVDGSRVRSAKMMSQEASDLAAMSTLASYNRDLKNDYGLFALKDSEKAGEIFDSYLKSSLQSISGEDSDYSDKLYESVKGLIFENSNIKSFTDLFDYKVGTSNVSTLYDLSQKEVLQNQIVEYTKYRGVYFLADRLSLLAKLSEAKEEYEKTQESTKLMEEKLELDEEAEKKIEEKILTLNKKISEFRNAVASASDDTKISAFKNNMRSAVKAADNAYDSHINDETWDENLSVAYNVYYSNGSVTTLIKQIESQCSELDKAGETAYKLFNEIKSSDISELINNIDEHISKLNEFRDNKVNSCSTEVVDAMKSDIADTVARYEGFKTPLLEIKQYMDGSAYQQDKKYLKISSSMYTNAYSALCKSLTGIINSPSMLKSDEDAPSGLKYYGLKEVGEEYKSDGAYTCDSYTAKEQYYGNEGCPHYSSLCGAIKNKFKEIDAFGNEEKKDYRSEAEESAKSANNKKDSFTGSSIPDSEWGSLPSKGEMVITNEKPDFKTDTSEMTKDTHSILSDAADIFSDLAEVGRDEALTYSYIFGMFKSRMSDAQKFNASTKPSEWKDYHVQWRYENDNGEHDLREKPKSEQDSVLNAEIEYIFGGNKSDSANCASVYAIIYATRAANNIAAVYANKNARDQCYAMGCATAAVVAATTAGVVTISPRVYQWIFITAWAIAETCIEMDFLINDGYRIPLIKTGANLIMQSITDVADLPGKLQTSVQKTAINVCYEDYLLILMCLMTNSETRVRRIADLVQLNMRKRYDNSFLMNKSSTYIKAETNVSISYLFRQISQFSDFYPGLGISFKNTIYQGY